MRKPYKGKQDVFDVGDLVAKEPYQQFYAWFDEAKKTDGIMEANAMSLATASKDGKPSLRMVLMKAIDKRGIVFYTNYLSKKSQDIEENPFASLLFYWSSNTASSTVSRQSQNPNCSIMFYWEPLMKSVRIEGIVEKVSEAESTEYFHSRPRSSQIGACVSERQSSCIKSREVLDKRNEDLNKLYEGNDTPIPKPDYWGGFRVVPEKFEFWQGQTNRLHDRIVFRKPEEGESVDPSVTLTGEDGWVLERLMP